MLYKQGNTFIQSNQDPSSYPQFREWSGLRINRFIQKFGTVTVNREQELQHVSLKVHVMFHIDAH